MLNVGVLNSMVEMDSVDSTVWSRFCIIGVGINNFKARFQQFLDEVLIGILIILDLLFGY